MEVIVREQPTVVAGVMIVTLPIKAHAVKIFTLCVQVYACLTNTDDILTKKILLSES